MTRFDTAGGVSPRHRHGSPRARTPFAVLACLAASAVALAVAPTLMPASYSWIAHTTSESAAQGVPGAWLARLGFALLGFGVLTLVLLAQDRWGLLATWMHASFGLLIVAAGLFSARSWDATVAFDATEDLLHSFSATAMGFAFAFGVAAVAWRTRTRRGGVRFIDVAAVLAAVVLPMGMALAGGAAGLLQRLMFAIAYAWYTIETLGVSGDLAVEPDAAPVG
jgi:hypothetical protein